jgi:hypothetical protein
VDRRPCYLLILIRPDEIPQSSWNQLKDIPCILFFSLTVATANPAAELLQLISCVLARLDRNDGA